MILAILLAAQAHTIAVLEFRDKVPKEERLDSAYLSDQVRTAVKEELPEARVITRENMLVLLQASGKDLAACEGECEVDTGRLIGADLVVSGELLKFGTQYKLNMKLHDTRSGELLSGAVAAGANPDQLDRDLRQSVRKLLGSLAHDALPAQRVESHQRERRLHAVAASVWLVAGYDWTSNTVRIPAGPASGFGLDLGGDLFLRVAGPVYLGGLLDYSLSGPNLLLVAAGARVLVGEVGLSGGFGYASVAEGGLGALLAVDFGVTGGLALRIQGSWRRSHSTGLRDPGLVPIEIDTTVLSWLAGLSLQL